MENVSETKKIEYISIPWASLTRFIVFLGSVGLCYLGFVLLAGFWKYLGLGYLSEKNITSTNQLVILPWFVIQYCLVGLTAICFCAWIKKGFRNLKSFSSPGLLAGLFIGLFAGFVGLLVGGFLAGLLIGLLAGLLFVGLVVGLVGLIYEFTN